VMRLTGLFLIGALGVLAACAPKTMPVPVVTTPRFPEFIQPGVPPALADSLAALNHDRAWAFFQSGDFRNAEREVAVAVTSSPEFFPSHVIAGYIELARKDANAALPHFDRALAGDRGYLPALVGKGQAFLALSRDAEALEAFEAALAVDPSLTDLQRRVEVLKFRGLERNLAAAREAAASGRTDEALAAYRAAIESSPESAFLYRELGAIERRRGENDPALEHFRKALALDRDDADTFMQVGQLLEIRGDLAGAMAAYEESLAIEPNAAVEARLDVLRARAAFERMPEEYRAIGASPRLTRGDFAALIGVRLGPLLETRATDGGVITDLRGHWAEPWILAVARAGVIEAFANHTFQPRAAVRRVDFAQAMSRLIARAAILAPGRAQEWQAARVRFPDMSTGHIAYPAASLAVAAGVIRTGADGTFQPSRSVTGEEAIAAIERLQGLANMTAEQKIERP
jgi:tetratricopeptide (TPR) repeat protein